MNKRVLSLILGMVLCITSAPIAVTAAASTTASSKTVHTGSVSAVITTNGDLYCWGDNNSGQMGNGKRGAGDDLGLDEVQITPVKVLSNVALVLNSDNMTSAITKNGDFYNWGHNYGQMGIGKDGSFEFQVKPLKILSGIRLQSAMLSTPALLPIRY